MKLLKRTVSSYLIQKLSIAALFILVILLNRTQAQNLLWTQTYGGAGQDGGESMVLTNSGGIVIAGFKSTNSLKDILIMKADALGNEIWSRTYNLGLNDIGRSVRQTQDGGFIIGGMTEVNPQTFDPFLIKTDSAGIMQWQRQYDYGLGDDDRAHSVWQTSDGGFIIAGQTWIGFPFGSYDFYVVKTDMSGNVQWQRTYAYDTTASPGADVALSIQQLSDGGYIIGGFTQGNIWASYLIRTNSLGNPIWTHAYWSGSVNECYSVQPTSDGGFILTGGLVSYVTDTDVLLIKTDAGGNQLWQKICGGTDADYGESVRQLQDGGFVVAGVTGSFGAGIWDVYVVRTNSSGDTLWTRYFGGASDDRGLSVETTQNGGLVVAGWAWSFGQGLGDVYLLKLQDSPVGVTGSSTHPTSATLYQNYPNPFNPSTRIQYELPNSQFVTLKVFDLQGREVATIVEREQPAGNYVIQWNGTGDHGQQLAGGVYFLRLMATDAGGAQFSEVRKMIIMK